MRRFVVGDNTIDRYLGDSPRDLIGGNALNVAVQPAPAGHDVRYYGAAGPDGELVRRALKGMPDPAQLDDVATAEWVHIGMQPRSREVRQALLFHRVTLASISRRA